MLHYGKINHTEFQNNMNFINWNRKKIHCANELRRRSFVLENENYRMQRFWIDFIQLYWNQLHDQKNFLVIKFKGIYPQIFMRTSSHLWGNSGQNEEFCLSSWVPCKVSSCSGFPIIHIRNSVISLRCLGTINICWLCFLCQEVLRNMQQVQKDGEFWLVGSKTCENSVFSVVSQNNSKQKILRNWMSLRRLVQNFF